MIENESKDRLYALIDQYKGGHVSTASFCEEFERIYNFDVSKANLLEVERVTFGMLFDKVVYYSPNAGERSRIANYLGDDDIRAAVDAALMELNRQPR